MSRYLLALFSGAVLLCLCLPIAVVVPRACSCGASRAVAARGGSGGG
jgi:hypothetical protein